MLEQNSHRVNYQVAILKQTHMAFPEISPHTNGHGWIMVDENLETLWTDSDIVPQQLIYIFKKTEAGTSDDEDGGLFDVPEEYASSDTDGSDSD